MHHDAFVHELVLGGQRSGKSRHAEGRALAWLDSAPGRSALLVATALAADAEMRERIARHRADRSPRLATVEAPVALADAIRRAACPERLVVVDCLTLWLTNLLMPAPGSMPVDDAALAAATASLGRTLAEAPGPVVLVSNEIGMGVSPLGGATRRFVDAIGRLHQSVAAVCPAVTLMVAGIAVPVKRP